MDVSINAKLAHIREHDVRVRLNIGGGLMGLLSVPPRSRSRFSTDCLFAKPADYRAHFVMPHYHQRGEGFRLEILGGPNNLRRIWESNSPVGENLGGPLASPVDLSGAEGIRFSCDYDNSTDETIVAGPTGADEMCSFFLHTDADEAWYAVVSEAFGEASLADLGTADDGRRSFRADGCVVLQDL